MCTVSASSGDITSSSSTSSSDGCQEVVLIVVWSFAGVLPISFSAFSELCKINDKNNFLMNYAWSK